MDHAIGRAVPTHGIQTVRVQRPARTYGLRTEADQHGCKDRFRCCVPVDAPALEPTYAEKTIGLERVPGRVGVKRQSDIGQHALVLKWSVTDHACRKGDRWYAHLAAETLASR